MIKRVQWWCLRTGGQPPNSPVEYGCSTMGAPPPARPTRSRPTLACAPDAGAPNVGTSIDHPQQHPSSSHKRIPSLDPTTAASASQSSTEWWWWSRNGRDCMLLVQAGTPHRGTVLLHLCQHTRVRRPPRCGLSQPPWLLRVTLNVPLSSPPHHPSSRAARWSISR